MQFNDWSFSRYSESWEIELDTPKFFRQIFLSKSQAIWLTPIAPAFNPIASLCAAHRPYVPKNGANNPSKIEWDLTNGPLTKLLELLDTKV